MKNFVVKSVFNIGQTNHRKKSQSMPYFSFSKLFALFFLVSKVIGSIKDLSLYICICCVMFTVLHLHWFGFHSPKILDKLNFLSSSTLPQKMNFITVFCLLHLEKVSFQPFIVNTKYQSTISFFRIYIYFAE